jgi:hypothetical protein
VTSLGIEGRDATGEDAEKKEILDLFKE